MRELSSAGRLAAWGSAALAGAVSPDEAADEVRGAHDAGTGCVGLPGEVADGEPAPTPSRRLRSLGATGLRLVLPRPGDAPGLPGPPAFNERAVGRGEAVLTVGGPPLGAARRDRAAPGRCTWSSSTCGTSP